MNTFPLIRTKWSNEHLMAGLFLVLAVYHIPLWWKHPSNIAEFLLLTATGLLVDCICNFIRYKRLWCSVSAAVTAGIISALANGIPLWGKLLGVLIALLLAKHLNGGTGKNLFNPAMVGMVFLLLLFRVPYPFLPNPELLLPGAILSLPFLLLRPYAGIGYLVGAAAAMQLYGDLTIWNLLAYGGVFFACIVVTDPVTVSNQPFTGSVGGFLAGFTALYVRGPYVAVAGILVLNIITYLMEKDSGKSITDPLHLTGLKLRKVIPAQNINPELLDLTDEKHSIKEQKIQDSQVVLERVKSANVYGMGGAGFSTYQKLMAVINSKPEEKHFILNGVECDPGLIHDGWLLKNYPEEIFSGMELISRCMNFTSVSLAVKATEELHFPDGLKPHKVSGYYPAGAEKLLISEVLHKEMEPEQIPAEHGILVLNIQTVYSVYEAVYGNKKADTRFLTVANLKKQDARVVKVRLGMKVQNILKAAYPERGMAFAGGGLMQSHACEEEELVDHTTNFIALAEFPRYKESPQCSGCGSCQKNCPAGLAVQKIAGLVDQNKLEEAAQYHPEYCISCGSCSYSCLAGRNLTMKVRAAKEAMKASMSKEYEN